MAEPSQPGRLRNGAIVLGLLLIPVSCHFDVASGQFRKSADSTTTSIFFHVVFLLLLLELLDRLLRRAAPKLALSRFEKLTVYTLAFAGCGIASRDWIQVALPLWGHGWHHATPENNWAAFLADVPAGLIVTDREALRDYFQGHSTLYTLEHWRAWRSPMLSWSCFFSVVWLTMLSINILIRRQWTEREKLSFPILQVPLEITTARNPLWRSRAFWSGFALAAAIDLVNGLHAFVPQVPQLKVKMTDLRQFFTAPYLLKMDYTPVSFFPFAIGLAFLLPTDLSFSCWFFYLFFKVQLAFFAWLGFDPSMGFDGQQGSMPFVSEQGIGAYLALGCSALWMARDHLRDVARRIARPAGVDDRLYRWAAAGLVGGSIYWLCFARYCGLSPWIAVVYGGLYYLVTTTITKIRAELGPPVHDLHFGGPDRMLLTWLGADSLTPADRIGFSLFFGFNRAYRGVPQPMMLEGMKAADICGGSQRKLVLALALAGPVAAFSASWAMLHWAYGDGMQFASEAYRLGGQAWRRMESWTSMPWQAGTGATVAMGVGALGCLLLTALRFRFLSFPFHPIGYAISANWAMNCVWLPILLGWAMKCAVLRAAGAKGYRAAIPFALGLILGEFVVGSLWATYGVVANVPVYRFWLF